MPQFTRATYDLVFQEEVRRICDEKIGDELVAILYYSPFRDIFDFLRSDTVRTGQEMQPWINRMNLEVGQCKLPSLLCKAQAPVNKEPIDGTKLHPLVAEILGIVKASLNRLGLETFHVRWKRCSWLASKIYSRTTTDEDKAAFEHHADLAYASLGDIILPTMKVLDEVDRGDMPFLSYSTNGPIPRDIQLVKEEDPDLDNTKEVPLDYTNKIFTGREGAEPSILNLPPPALSLSEEVEEAKMHVQLQASQDHGEADDWIFTDFEDDHLLPLLTAQEDSLSEFTDYESDLLSDISDLETPSV